MAVAVARMNIEDTDVVNAQRDSSPSRFRSYDPSNQFIPQFDRVHSEYSEYVRRQSQAASRKASRADQDVPFQEAREEPEMAAGEEREPVEEVEEPRPARGRRRPSQADTASLSSSAASSTSVRQEELRGDRPRPRPRHMSAVSTTSTVKMERELMEYIDRHPTAIGRIEQHRLQHMQTVGSSKAVTKEGIELPDFGSGKPYPPALPEREEYVVEFSGFDDPRHAQNFPMKKKLVISGILIFNSLAATFASSIFSAASQVVGQDFHMGREVVTLGTSLFVLGYAMGPSVFAPISELYGRRIPIILASFGFGVFNTAVAVAKDYQTLMISRFFGGFFGSAPLAITGAVFADMFNNKASVIGLFFHQWDMY